MLLQPVFASQSSAVREINESHDNSGGSESTIVILQSTLGKPTIGTGLTAKSASG